MKTGEAQIQDANVIPSSEVRQPSREAVTHAVDLLRRTQPVSSVLAPAEQEALETIYRAYLPMVRETVYPLLASTADAEDVAQTVFLGLPRALRRYTDGNFEAWLRRVAARTALMWLRKDRREENTVRQVAASAIADDRGWHVALTGEDDPGLDDGLRAMRGAFYALPETLREVVFLRAIVELSHTEIAEWLEISVAASYTRYCRGLQQVRRMMKVAHG